VKINPKYIIAGLIAWVVLGRKSTAGASNPAVEKKAVESGLPPIQAPPPDVAINFTQPWRAGGHTGYSGYPLPDLDPASTRDAYIDQLFAREQQFKAPIREAYSVPRLKQIAIAAGAFYGVPPSWVYGILQGESNFFPVGIFKGYTGTSEHAKNAKSSAFGMGQMLKGRWNYEKSFAAKSSYDGAPPHWFFIDPKAAIWSVAGSYGRMMHNRGGGYSRDLGKQYKAIQKAARGGGSPSHQGSLAVGHWWAGQTEGAKNGAKAKTRQILKYGMQVYQDGVRRPSSSWQKGAPPVHQHDWLPPWRIGSLTFADQQNILTTASILETAGDELRVLNQALV
jgi:hypothetical protein